MATHPLTRVTTWYAAHLNRNRREWIAAMLCMFGFWDASFGHWNLLLLAIAVIGAKLSRANFVHRALRRFVDYYLDALEAYCRRRVISRGAAAWIRAFPRFQPNHEYRRLARHTLKDGNGRVVYRIELYADPKRAHVLVDGTEYIRVVVTILDLRRTHKTRTVTGRMRIDDFSIGGLIKIFDPESPIADVAIRVLLLRGRVNDESWIRKGQGGSTKGAKSAKRAPTSPKGRIVEAIMKIADGKIRGSAHAIANRALGNDAEISAARRDFAKLLHPDICKEPNAQEALALINAQLDLAEKLAA